MLAGELTWRPHDQEELLRKVRHTDQWERTEIPKPSLYVNGQLTFYESILTVWFPFLFTFLVGAPHRLVCRSFFPEQGSSPRPLQGACAAVTTRPPGVPGGTVLCQLAGVQPPVIQSKHTMGVAVKCGGLPVKG